MSRLLWISALLTAAIMSTTSAEVYTFNDAATPRAQTTKLSDVSPSAAIETTASFTELRSFNDENEDEDSLDSVDSGSFNSADSRPSAMTSGSVVSTIESTYTNWVGLSLGDASDSACYREALIATTCPVEFETKHHTKHHTCWAECPLPYPVKCGLECIRQNDDCEHEVAAKISVVAQSAFSLATFGLCGEFKLMAKSVRTSYKCGKEVMNLVKNLNKYLRAIKLSHPDSTEEWLAMTLYHTDNVVFGLPITIASCLGMRVSETIRTIDRITNAVELLIKEIVSNSDEIVSSWAMFKAFMEKITLAESIDSLDEMDIASLKSALKSNSTCGYDMKRLLDRTWMTVADLRKKDPEIPEDDIRVAMSESNLVLNEIPIMTNNCMEELVAESDDEAAYRTRDALRKTIGGILEDLIKAGTSSNGTLFTAEKYAYTIADKAVTFYAVWDVTNIAGVVAEYFQTTCGPTKFIGEVDDGSAADALGLHTVGEAFSDSTGSWMKEGDGKVTITFKSVDSEDVRVNIKSGGNKIDEVAVPAGETVVWDSNVTTLGAKTLYLDRSRPDFLGLPGTGGGSLLLWVPRSTQGGHLELTAMLNES